MILGKRRCPQRQAAKLVMNMGLFLLLLTGNQAEEEQVEWSTPSNEHICWRLNRKDSEFHEKY